MSALEWTRPFGLVALALPVLLLLAARLLDRPRAEVTGTMDVWERAGGAPATGGARRRRRLPRGVLPIAIALALGALALGGPALERPPAGRLWTVVLDRSPGMGLPANGVDGETRLERALGELATLLAEHGQPGDRVRWTSPGLPAVVAELGAGPPADLASIGRAPAARPDWTWHDAAGAVWVTDRAPYEVAERAGLARSGGAQALGLAAVEGSVLHTWDGEALLPAGTLERVVGMDQGLPPLIVSFVETWARAQGVAIHPGPRQQPRGQSGVDLTVTSYMGAGAEPFRAGRDGFVLEGVAVRGGVLTGGEAAPDRTWLAASDGTPLVAHRPGLVAVGIRELVEPGGDAAAFAVAWARLLDGALLPPPGLVSVADRASAGEPSRRAPAAPPALERGVAPPPLEALLAIAAGLIGLLGAFRLGSR